MVVICRPIAIAAERQMGFVGCQTQARHTLGKLLQKPATHFVVDLKTGTNDLETLVFVNDLCHWILPLFLNSFFTTNDTNHTNKKTVNILLWTMP